VQLDFAAREVAIKVVYYGPALSGKTTNLLALHRRVGEGARGRLMTLETQDDRTLFFDLLPLRFRSGRGDASIRVKVFTVPGQPLHGATRRLVLQGADGVAMIADSRESETQNNAASFLDLRENLRENGLTLSKMPLVIQFNKRDLPGVRGDAELAALAAQGREPIFSAVALRDEGVIETFLATLLVTWQALDRDHGLSKRLAIDGLELVSTAARELGVDEPITEILSRRVGGPIALGSGGAA
jgi:signal recognition particle receptor subunit beta